MSERYLPGLEGVVAAQTALSRVDGEKGELLIGGYPLDKLATETTFEEVVYLLWYGNLPDANQLSDFRHALADRRRLPDVTLALLIRAAEMDVPVMDALRMAASTLTVTSTTTGDPAGEPILDAMTIIAAFPTIVAAYWRLLQGVDPLAPNDNLGHASNFLYMLFGDDPSEEQARGLETYLITVVDHGLNASTFALRVIISTGSDMNSAVVGALGALKGPLHGGAPGPALDMVFDIGDAENAEPYLRNKLENGERLMGFGHRIYKMRDPRAEVLADAAKQMFEAAEDMWLYDLAKEVERVAVELLEEYKPGRHLKTNVEYYTALLLHGLELSNELFTPTFAIGRAGGWTAHAFEQIAAKRLIRPKAEYIGPTDRELLPLDKR